MLPVTKTQIVQTCYPTQKYVIKRVIQPENIVSNAKTCYSTQKCVIQRKNVSSNAKSMLSNAINLLSNTKDKIKMIGNKINADKNDNTRALLTGCHGHGYYLIESLKWAKDKLSFFYYI